MGQLVNKTLYSECIVRVSHRTPEANRNRGINLHIFNIYIGYLVFHIHDTLHRDRVNPIFHQLRVHTGENGWNNYFV